MINTIITVGISGSGKSTWSSSFIKQNPDYLIANRDSIRKSLVGDMTGYYQSKFLKRREEIVTELIWAYVQEICAENFNLVFDNTNLKKEYFLPFLDKSMFNTKFKLFDVTTSLAKERVNNRDFDGKATPEQLAYIDKHYYQYVEIKTFLMNHYKHLLL